jgi:hypothetical protein
MAMRWLCRADARQGPVRREEKTNAVAFKSQPMLNLATQPIAAMLHATGAQTANDKNSSTSNKTAGTKRSGTPHSMHRNECRAAMTG